jgi:hypothetical protein
VTAAGKAKVEESNSSVRYFPIRRSTRLPLEIPLRVTSLDPEAGFAENCKTATVSAHGCGLVSPRPVAAGTRVQLAMVAENQATAARVLDVVALDESSWLLGIEMDRAGNFWGIKYAPADWTEEEAAGEPAAASPEAPDTEIVPPAPPAEPKEASQRAGSGTTAAATAPPASAPKKAAPRPMKEIPPEILKRLLSECRLGAISAGACYVQTLRTLPLFAPVTVSVQAGSEHAFHGTVRTEHVGAGMGIEFTDSGEEHAGRVAALISALGTQADTIPRARVELAAPDKKNPPKPKKLAAAAAENDSLLSLVLSGGSMKRGDFLRELKKQSPKV